MGMFNLCFRGAIRRNSIFWMFFVLKNKKGPKAVGFANLWFQRADYRFYET